MAILYTSFELEILTIVRFIIGLPRVSPAHALPGLWFLLEFGPLVHDKSGRENPVAIPYRAGARRRADRIGFRAPDTADENDQRARSISNSNAIIFICYNV